MKLRCVWVRRVAAGKTSWRKQIKVKTEKSSKIQPRTFGEGSREQKMTLLKVPRSTYTYVRKRPVGKNESWRDRVEGHENQTRIWLQEKGIQGGIKGSGMVSQDVLEERI